jgi:hypothetical protein
VGRLQCGRERRVAVWNGAVNAAARMGGAGGTLAEGIRARRVRMVALRVAAVLRAVVGILVVLAAVVAALPAAAVVRRLRVVAAVVVTPGSKVVAED